jgi:hypothetical protein
MTVDRLDDFVANRGDLVEKAFYRLSTGVSGVRALNDKHCFVIFREYIQLTWRGSGHRSNGKIAIKIKLFEAHSAQKRPDIIFELPI